MTTATLSGATPEPQQPLAHRLVDRERPRRDRDRQPFLELEEAVHTGFEARGKRVRKNSGIASWRSRMSGTPANFSGQRGEGQEVGQRVDLDEREACAAVEPRGASTRPDEEGQVLAQVDTETGALVALDVEPPDLDTGELAVAGRSGRRRPRTTTGRPLATSDRPRAGPAGPPRSGCGRSSGPVGGAGSRARSGSSPRASSRRRMRPWRPRTSVQARADQPAPRRRTWRGRVVRPCELSTVSTTRSASRVDARPSRSRGGR